MKQGTSKAHLRCPVFFSGVYRITCEATGDFYIGSSRDMVTRLRDHRNSLRAGSHPVKAMQALFDNHGETSFSVDAVEIIECWRGGLGPQQRSFERETYWRKLLKPTLNTIGTEKGRQLYSRVRRERALAK